MKPDQGILEILQETVEVMPLLAIACLRISAVSTDDDWWKDNPARRDASQERTDLLKRLNELHVLLEDAHGAEVIDEKPDHIYRVIEKFTKNKFADVEIADANLWITKMQRRVEATLMDDELKEIIRQRLGVLARKNDELDAKNDELKAQLQTIESTPLAAPPKKSRAENAKIKNEKNIEARKYLLEHQNATVKEVGTAIGKGKSYVNGLRAWRAVQEERDKAKAAKPPKMRRFTGGLEKAIGTDGNVLEALVKESEQDNKADPSPLAPDPPNDADIKPHSRGRVYRD